MNRLIGMRLSLLLILMCFWGLLVRCKKYTASDPAIFVTPGVISVATTTAQGSGSHKITDLWVYVDGNFKGAYPVTATIPLITQNQGVGVDVLAGIKDNGLKDTRIPWPFYETVHFDTLVEAGKTILRNFTFKYRASTNFTWTENFEGQGISIQKSPISNADFTVQSGPDGFEGRYLHIAGNSANPIVQIESAGTGFTLPQFNSNVYLELNYKCTELVTVGLITKDGYMKDVMYLNPTSTWNKIYISLSSTLNTNYSVNQKVFFKMVKLEGNPDPELFLDNIKLVYLE